MRDRKEFLTALGGLDARFIEEAAEERYFEKTPRWRRFVGAVCAMLVLCATVMIPFAVTNMHAMATETSYSFAQKYCKWNGTQFELSGKDTVIRDCVAYQLIDLPLYARFDFGTAERNGKKIRSLEYLDWDSEVANSAVRLDEQDPSICILRPVTEYAVKSANFLSYRYTYVMRDTDAAVGEKLGITTITEEYSKQTYIAEIYEIKSIDPDYAVYMKYNDRYYIYYQAAKQEFTSWGDLVRAFGLSENLVMDDAGEMAYMICSLFGEEAREGTAWGKLVVLENKETFLSVSATLPILGENYVGFQIYRDGTLITNVGRTLKTFNIGSESAAKLFAYAEENPSEAYHIVETD